LGEVALAAGDRARAADLFAESVARFRAAGNAHDEAIALRRLALLARASGDATTAGARLAAALALWRKGGWEDRVAETLETLAVLAGADGEPARALHLAGAAAAVRETVGRPLAVLRRAAFERQVTASRRALHPAAAAAALARGRAMSPEAAIDEALGGGHPAAGVPPDAEPGRTAPPAPATSGTRSDAEEAAAPAAGLLRVDPEQYTVWRGEQPLPRPLAAKEFALVAYLYARPGRVCSRQELGDAIWGRDRWDPDMLYRLVRRVKEKLEPQPARPRYLQNVPGFGYRLSP
jgi:DNA-binding response OmpR family regulator